MDGNVIGFAAAGGVPTVTILYYGIRIGKWVGDISRLLDVHDKRIATIEDKCNHKMEEVDKKIDSARHDLDTRIDTLIKR